MSSETENLVSSFRSLVAEETIKHRGRDAGLVDAFVESVTKHHTRYLDKIANLRPVGADAVELSSVEAQIKVMVDEAISNAQAAGKVDFKPEVA